MPSTTSTERHAPDRTSVYRKTFAPLDPSLVLSYVSRRIFVHLLSYRNPVYPSLARLHDCSRSVPPRLFFFATTIHLIMSA